MATKTAEKTKTIVKYATPKADIRSTEHSDGPLTVSECKTLIGWTEEPEDDDWGTSFVLKDTLGKKIRLKNNPTNRPFKRPLADRYANEHLRGKWSLNLESIVIDKKGFVLQGQHRFVGFILAEQLRQLDPTRWGDRPLQYSTLIAFGASSNPQNANTYDLGAKRSLNDVLYRHQKFPKSVSDKQQKKISACLATSIRLVWLRVGGKQVSFAPHFPHSEALEFYKNHPEILQSVKTIVELDDGEGSEKNISSLVSLGYAAALHYLMSKHTDEKEATRFWESFATGEGLSKASPILSLRQFLIKVDMGGSKRDEIVGTIIKAWLLWHAKKSGTRKQIKIAKKKEGDRFVLSEFPRIGGLDSEVTGSPSLTQRQRIILATLKKLKKEVTYKELCSKTGLSLAQIASVTMPETKAGKVIPHGLCTRKLVSVAQYEPQKGEKFAPFYFKITVTGKKAV